MSDPALPTRKSVIGVALGSGSARGWSHIGVMRALKEHGLKPAVITGASTGALVAAACASDQLDELENWVRTLTKMDVWRLLDATFTGGGVMRGSRVMRAIGEQLEDRTIESLALKYGAVAVDLFRGQEVWIRKGSMLNAVRASSGLPGLFTPILHDGRWLIDGGVLNPVPVSLCRALGADYVIAVDLSMPVRDHRKKRSGAKSPIKLEVERPTDENNELFARWSGLLQDFVASIRSDREPSEPGMIEVMYTTMNIMQEQIARSRMLGDPADLVVTPQLDYFHLMDFHRAAEAIEVGQAATEARLASL